MPELIFDYDDLRDFQKDDVAFLLDCPPEMKGHRHRLLCNDPGLGKTCSTCVALVKYGAKSALIICPAPHKDTWAKHLVDWGVCEESDIYIVRTRIDYPNKPFVVVSFELLLADLLKRTLMKKRFDAVVVDEIHRCKTPEAAISKIILGTKGPLIERGELKIGLSGTITPNRTMELYTHLSALAPMLISEFRTQEKFGKYFCGGNYDGRGMVYLGNTHTEELAARCKPFMRRKEIKDVFKELPPVLENEVFFDIGELGASIADTPLATLRKLVGDAKTAHVVDYVKDRLANSAGKVLLYTYHQSVTEGLCAGLQEFGAVKYYGPMTAKQKAEAKQTFIQNKSCRVLIAQVQSCGESVDGLQLVCNNIVRAELDWSDGGERQTTGRLHRFLQTEPVYETYLVAKNTLDDRILRSQYKKREVTNLFYSLIKGSVMSIDALLERFVVAVEKIAANGGTIQLGNGNGKVTQTPANAKPAETAAVAAPAVPSAEDLSKAALKALQKHGGKQPAKDLVKACIQEATGGVAGTTKEVTAAQRASVIAALGMLAEQESEAELAASV